MTFMFSVKPQQSTWEELPDETLGLTDSDLLSIYSSIEFYSKIMKTKLSILTEKSRNKF